MKRRATHAERLNRLQVIIAAAMGEVDRLYRLEAAGDDRPEFDIDAVMTVVLGQRLAAHAIATKNNRYVAVATATLRRSYEQARRDRRESGLPVDLATEPTAGRA